MKNKTSNGWDKTVLNEVKNIHPLGVALHWLHPKDKRPVKTGWTKTKGETVEQLFKTHKPNYNLGAKLDQFSKLANGKYLAVIDVDIKTHPKLLEKTKKEVTSWLDENLPGLLESAPIVMSGRSNGSMHIWVCVDETMRSYRLATSSKLSKVYMPSAKVTKEQVEKLGQNEVNQGYRLRPSWEIDFMSRGKQVVLPPSIHPDSNKPYKWKNKEALELVDLIPTLTQKQLEAISITPSNGEDGIQAGKGSPSQKDDTNLNVLKKWKPVEVDPFELETRLDPKPLLALTNGANVEDRSASLFSVCLSLVKARFEDAEILTLLTDKENALGSVAYEHAKTNSRKRAAAWIYKYNLAKAKNEICAESVFKNEFVETDPLTDDEAKEQGKWVQATRPWLEKLERSSTKGSDGLGRIKPTLKNTDLIFQNAIDSRMVVRDLFSLDETYGCDTPWGTKTGDPITDLDQIGAKAWLSHNYRVEPSVNIVDEAMKDLGQRNAFHPVRDYLNGLEWDGEPRIENFFVDVLGAKEKAPYINEASKIFFLACVARVFEPGIKFDHMVILQGNQGIGKSTFGRILAGGKWFNDSLGGRNLNDKDTALGLRGVWINEIGELASLGKQEIEDVKAFITRQVDKVRPPYGRREVVMPRQTVFFGSTNNSEYLKDRTGNRRFWPVTVGIEKLDFEMLEKMRDQLWAEARHLWVTERPKLYLTPESEEFLKVEQVEHMVYDFEDHLYETLELWLDDELQRPIDSRFPLHKFTQPQLFDDMNGPFYGMKQNSGTYQKTARILRKAGFEKARTNSVRFWFHPLA